MAIGDGVALGKRGAKQPAAVLGKREGDASIAPLPPELTELQAGFRARSDAESKRQVEATDTEFWFAVCFETREQKEEFLEKTGLGVLGDKYLDGREVAGAVGVELSARGVAPKLGRVDKKLAALVKR